MKKYIQDEFVNRCSCKWEKDRFAGGSFFMTDDPEKIKKIENSPFFRQGIIKIAGETPVEPVVETVAEVEPVVEVEEEKEVVVDGAVIDKDALSKALSEIEVGKTEKQEPDLKHAVDGELGPLTKTIEAGKVEEPEDVTSEPELIESKPVINTTIEQKNQAQRMQPRQTPRAVEWKEMTALAKEKGIPTTGKGVNRPYLADALSKHGVFVQ